MHYETNSIKPKILIVEDNYVICQELEVVLADAYFLTSVNNSLYTIKEVLSMKYDLILMDINLGIGVNGIQTTKMIKKISPYKDIPVVVMSGQKTEFFNDITKSNIFAAYIPKLLNASLSEKLYFPENTLP